MLPHDPKANIDPDIDLLEDEVDEESSLPAIDEVAEPAAAPLASGVLQRGHGTFFADRLNAARMRRNSSSENEG